MAGIHTLLQLADQAGEIIGILKQAAIEDDFTRVHQINRSLDGGAECLDGAIHNLRRTLIPVACRGEDVKHTQALGIPIPVLSPEKRGLFFREDRDGILPDGTR